MINNAISNGGNSMFKSITTYDLNGNAINITGKGIVTYSGMNTTVMSTIDGISVAFAYNTYGGIYLFGSSLQIPSGYYGRVIIGLLN